MPNMVGFWAVKLAFEGQRANWPIVNTSSPSSVYDFVGILYAWPQGQKIESTSRAAWDAGL
jgi:hypothetical protein